MIPEPNFTEVYNDTQAKQLANSLQNVIFGENVRFLEGWHRPKSTIADDEDVLDIRTYRCGIKKPPMQPDDETKLRDQTKLLTGEKTVRTFSKNRHTSISMFGYRCFMAMRRLCNLRDMEEARLNDNLEEVLSRMVEGYFADRRAQQTELYADALMEDISDMADNEPITA